MNGCPIKYPLHHPSRIGCLTEALAFRKSGRGESNHVESKRRIRLILSFASLRSIALFYGD
jgi:hypothetical protein